MLIPLKGENDFLRHQELPEPITAFVTDQGETPLDRLNREAADNAKKAGVTDRVRFLTGDLFEADISQATVVTLFLLPRINQDLIPKLRRELRPGTRIVSHQFDMGEQWPPEQSQDVNGLMIYLWTIK